MEVVPKSISPHLERVLKSYQTSANRTLQGPGHVVLLSPAEMAKLSAEEYRKGFDLKQRKVDFEHRRRLPTPFPVQQMPVFATVDSSRSEKTETILEGESIACFDVGGEKRLCLPQILTTVLREFTLQEINTVCDDLHIYCSRCLPDQLEILKVTGNLPVSAPSCGLITKTDAERLCNALKYNPPESMPSHPSPNSFKVYHECFGKCKGIFNPEAYTKETASCILCGDCGLWFSPHKFVCHSHKALENRTCHWGFDSANWRSYLLVAKHQPAIDKLQEVLEQMKCRFDGTGKHKRKQVEVQFDTAKRSKSEDSSSPTSPWPEQQSSTLRAMMSAFQPWSPAVTAALKDGKMLPAAPAIMREGFAGTVAPSYLHSGPPVLLHPDKVVPHSESSRYESNYAPNVSLAPVQKCKGEDDDEDEEFPEKKPSPLSDPGPSKPYKEWEIISDTDDSSVERSTPSNSEDMRLSPSSSNHRALEIELEMIRQALDGKIGTDKEEKDRFLREFCKLRARHEELLNQNVQARRNLKKELSSTKAASQEKLQVANDKNHVMEKELTKLRRESASRISEVQGDKAKLIKNVKALQEFEDIEVGKMLQINQELQARLQHYEIAYEQLRCENLLMQEKLLHMGVNILDVVSKNTMNGNLKLIRSASGSPQRSPTETGLSPRNLGYLGPLVLQQPTPLKEYMKKERDT